MHEFSAALGLLQLKHIGQVIELRRAIDALYRRLLADVHEIECLPRDGENVDSNYAYFPVLVTPTRTRDRETVDKKLRSQNVFARRYFYPLISDFPMYRGLPSAGKENLPVASDAANRV